MSTFPTGNHTQLSWADVYKVARQAGFSPAAAVIATAITQPEADRMPGIQQSGQPYRTTGWGLWQITPGDSVPSVGVDDALLDPLTNARAAYAKYHAAGNSFRPWTTYTSGAYRAYLGDAQAAASGVGNAIGGAVGAGAAAAGSLGGAGGLGGGVGGSGLGGPVVDWSSTFKAITAFIGSGGQPGNEVQGQVNTIVGGNLPDWVKATFSFVSGFVDWLGPLVDDLGKLVSGLLWLVNPMNWVRMIAGVIGAISIIIGAILVAKAA